MAAVNDQTKSFDHEVAVLGGGPAGATAAAMLARKGRRVVLLEPEPFPRFHIGESLLSMANSVFRELGLHERMHASGFTKKRGARFLDAEGTKDVLYDFANNPKIPEPQTFQVPRAEFDALLLEHAVASGARHLPRRAKDIAFDDDGVTLWCDGLERPLRVEAVVDATGRAGFVSRKLGLREPDAELQKLAVHAHYRGVPRDEGIRAGDIKIVSHQNLGWAWLIPLPDDVMSIGFVLDLQKHRDIHGKKPPQELIASLIASWPVVTRLCARAERVSEARIESSFSYRTRRYSGRRFLLAGDAGSFLDPVFSSGVMFALFAGVEAATALDAALARGNLAREPFAHYQSQQHERYELVRKFVVGFYDPAFRDLFFNPKPAFGLVRAMTGVLGGMWNPGRADRLRLKALFGIARLQRVVTLMPRVHTAHR